MDTHFYPLTIREVRRESRDSISLIFDPEPHFGSYMAGQFLTLKASIGGEPVRRAYSLCSSPAAAEPLAITIKKVEGGKMSSWALENLKAGDTLEVMPPIGNFIFQPQTAKKRWFFLVAAGSGITPVFSILKTILLSEPQSYVSLLFGNRSEEDILYRTELQNWSDRFPSRLKVLHTLSQPSDAWFGERGRIDEGCIQHNLENLKPVSPFDFAEVYVCGPGPMMDTVVRIVQEQGVKKEHVHRESFSSSVDELSKAAAAEALQYRERKVEIRLDGRSYTVDVPVGTTILDAALDRDIDMPYSCQSGLCTACRGKCLSGKVHMDEREGLSDEEMDEGYVLTCVSHPLTDQVVIEIG